MMLLPTFLIFLVAVSSTIAGPLKFKARDEFIKLLFHGDKDSVQCGDKGLECPTQQTCCSMKHGGWSCCRYQNAVCCDDQLHCCPDGTVCNVTALKCERKNSEDSIEVMKLSIQNLENKLISIKVMPSVKKVICPNGFECPDETTCCQLSTGAYGCCPMPKANCCADHIHCCASDQKCDLKTGACTKGDISQPLVKKVKAKLSKVICPDKRSTCPDGCTCCPLASNSYGCCPIPNAICCKDHQHCCPQGYTCADTGGCKKNSTVIPWFEKQRATIQQQDPAKVICPDKRSTCPDGCTCCPLASNSYGCCPIPNAICCKDHQHCCPQGYTCADTGGCKKNSTVIPWFEKQKATIQQQDPINVFCPDGKSCPKDNTCCLLGEGKYGCCPLPKATCCSDHLHCCPEGYMCHPAEGTCTKGSLSLPWVRKEQTRMEIPSDVTAMVKVDTDYVVCPGEMYECPDKNTCCSTQSKTTFSCCPLPHAVCCKDFIHCCPSGYTCSGKGMCAKAGEQTIAAIKKTLATKRSAPPTGAVQKSNVGIVFCKGGHVMCPDGMTCCDEGSGLGCCPIPNAVCCSDKRHCCPEGYTCDGAAGTCNKDVMTLPWFTNIKRPFTNPPNSLLDTKSSLNSKNVICPDQASQCPDGNTCCKLASGQYGCCPLPKAVCCSDHLHCCPNGYTCDVSGSKCNKDFESVPWVKKVPVNSFIDSGSKSDVGSVVCPDRQGTCPDGSTCCIMDSGKYGCCPLANATCCQDHTHCCPHGYTCDVTHGKCNASPTKASRLEESIPSFITLSAFKKIQSKKYVGAVICPDQASQCPDGNTCCKLASGQYGCCPLPKAVCCSDHVHCCPNGYTCDVSGSKCNKDFESVLWVKKVPANIFVDSEIKSNVGSVVCPDRQGTCPDGSTCCIMDSGKYGCCPLPNATCCQDHTHCCPHGYTCDVAQGKCNASPTKAYRLEESIPSFITLSAFKKIQSKKSVGAVICPDQASQCPDGNTCCKLASGQYGCCPLPKAVCCSDHVHCCPNGYTCDVSGSKCNKDFESVPWVKKVPANIFVDSEIKSNVGSVICPDRQGTCPDGSTCCIMDSGKYGCCPLPNATCCQDHTHCCPHGYTCDVAQGKCNARLLVSKLETVSKSSQNGVTCPDNISKCPDDHTCCKLISGQYGCCRLKDAVCCSDHIHCCPKGHKCDIISGRCKKHGVSVPWVEKVPAGMMEHKESAIICPDGESECPDGNTCCPMHGGGYGCCPLALAVCCSDKLHCCPHGYTCNVGGGTCSKGRFSIPWILKNSARQHISNQITTEVESIICPDGVSQCPGGNTCCQLISGQYGCCPLPEAVCCNDHVHCCPNGYSCDVKTGTCNTGLLSLPWFEKTGAQMIPKV